MSTSKPVNVTIWFDYTCPWCYVGLRRLDQVAAEFPIQIDRRPYLLAPDRPPEGEPRPLREGESETELSPAWQERAAAAGVVMRRPRINPNTIPAHEVTAYAREQGKDNEFHHAAARLLWEKGTNLGDAQVLRQVAEEAGLNWAELSALLQSGHYRPQVMQMHLDAKELGVFGTPTYRFGESGEPTFGDLSLDDLREAVRKAIDE